jgi:hypothetical protein
MQNRRTNAIEPTSKIFMPGHDKRATAELFGIEAEGSFLRRILAVRNGPFFGFRYKVIAETS